MLASPATSKASDGVSLVHVHTASGVRLLHGDGYTSVHEHSRNREEPEVGLASLCIEAPATSGEGKSWFVNQELADGRPAFATNQGAADDGIRAMAEEAIGP